MECVPPPPPRPYQALCCSSSPPPLPMTHLRSPQDRYWPLFLAVVAIPASLQLLLLHCFPESPRFLLIERNDVCGATEGEGCPGGGTACGCASSHAILTANISHITQTFSPTELSHSISQCPSLWCRDISLAPRDAQPRGSPMPCL